MNHSSSKETQQDALKVAKSIQKPGQTKEQTKLIAQGIEKGISEFKKQQKTKARERDKQRKQQLKKKNEAEILTEENSEELHNTNNGYAMVITPWVLLMLSWGFFATLYFN